MPSAARRAAKTAAATPGFHVKPHGKRTPPGCYWDGWVEPAGSFRRSDTHELYDADVTTNTSRDAHASTMQQRRATAVRSRRTQRVNKARCNSLLFQRRFVHRIFRWSR